MLIIIIIIIIIVIVSEWPRPFNAKGVTPLMIIIDRHPQNRPHHHNRTPIQRHLHDSMILTPSHHHHYHHHNNHHHHHLHFSS